MISILITAAALLAQQVSAPVAPKARVEGTVINSLNQEVVPKATVILRAHDEDHGVSYADETDGHGHFSIDNVEPGEYAVFAERSGFAFQSSGATGAPPPAVKVETGEQIKNIKIPLTPLGVISGHVLDADGEPVRGANVEALRYVYSAGKKQLRNVDQVQSGDNGDFRLFGLRAGTFYLRVTHTPPRGAKGPVGPVSTYYPGTADESHAAPVELRSGAQLKGIDIRLQSTGDYSIRFEFPEGHAPEGGYGAFLMNDQGVLRSGAVTFSMTGVVFPGVPPGSWEAVFSVFNEDKKAYAVQHVEVVNADIDGGTLNFLPPVEVTGSVRVEGGTFSGFDKLHINLRWAHPTPMLGNFTAEVQSNGSFLVKDVIPEVYEVAIGRTPGVYLKSVRIGDKVMTDRRIDLSSKPEPLVIVLGADIGEVEGSVRNAKGDPVVRARVNVIAYGDHSTRTDLNRVGFTDEKGEFTIKELAPGDYKVFAWEDVPVGAPQDPEFRKPFEKQAAPLRMPPNGREKVSVTAIAPVQADRSSQ